MSDIPDFTDSEQWTIKSSLDEHWGKDAVKPELVDVEARLDPTDRELIECTVSLLRLQADHESTISGPSRNHRQLNNLFACY